MVFRVRQLSTIRVTTETNIILILESPPLHKHIKVLTDTGLVNCINKWRKYGNERTVESFSRRVGERDDINRTIVSDGRR